MQKADVYPYYKPTISGEMSMPHVSIGLPVFNGENYLEEALQSILAQTYVDFELIITDNCSTDRTQEICETYARLDQRIRYYRNPSNLGAAPNFNQTVALARGTYFKWAAHDDLLLPTYLEKCVAVLDSHPQVVLCHSQVKEIDAYGQLIKYHVDTLPHTGASTAHERFADLIFFDHPCHDVFGLMRLDVLKETQLIASIIGSDRILLAELGLRGQFYRVAEPLFVSRSHPAQSVRAMPLHRRRQWFDSQLRESKSFPHWRYWIEFDHCLDRVQLAPAEKFACYLQILRYPSWAAVRLVKDLITALSPDRIEALKAQNPAWLCQLRAVESSIFEPSQDTLQKSQEQQSLQSAPLVTVTAPITPGDDTLHAHSH